MGWTVLYIAFGVVALWLLGEVLLQYKARLRWRLLAFVGFLGVVAGVVVPSVVVIAVGAVAFAVGQTYVTLSFRRGFAAGWAVRKRAKAGGDGAGPRSGRRRKGGSRPAAAARPPAPPAAEEPVERTAAMPAVEEAPQPAQQPAAAPQAVAYGGGYGDASYTGAAAQDTNVFGAYDGHVGQHAPDLTGQHGDSGQFAYGQGQYAAYSDPYIGSRPQSYEPYDAYGQYPTQGGQGYPHAPDRQYDIDTPPGGVWVPQQRDGEHPPQQPPNQSQHHTNGHDGQQHYRY
ncbi:hypothetical protein ACFP1Z_23615 [Streptomyces gamaensis]|uniref:Integral membrane protein n=1 Tax=Streptomyces gamaensis TaxID=1763542 RepID=A0ABW0Z3Z9_9ACTN